MLSNTFTYYPGVGDADRIDRLYFSVESCDVGLGLAKQVYYLSRPAFTARASDCPTSCVITRPGGHVIFQFNRQFFDELGIDEVAFVTLHEALHIAFRHAERRGNRDPAIWNVACDIVINELLLAQPAFSAVTSETFKKLIDGAATLAKFQQFILYGGQLPQMSAEVVYDRIVNHPGLRRAVRQLIATLRPFHVDLEMTQPGGSDGVESWHRELLARRLDRILDGQRFHGWSNEESGEFRQVQAVRVGIVPWDQLLLKRVRSALRDTEREAWIPSRRMAALYPAVILPSEQPRDERGKISLLLAIDCSGSISRDLLNRLLAVTRSIPRAKVNLTAISFDVSAYPFDLDDPKARLRGGGGTNFGCIEQHALEMPRYPDLVAVLTDGAGDAPRTAHGPRWLWLLTPPSTDIYVRHVGNTARISV